MYNDIKKKKIYIIKKQIEGKAVEHTRANI